MQNRSFKRSRVILLILSQNIILGNDRAYCFICNIFFVYLLTVTVIECSIIRKCYYHYNFRNKIQNNNGILTIIDVLTVYIYLLQTFNPKVGRYPVI